ncbi:MAG: VWA domain-containing protein [Elusimicrobiales bacterium]|nr:VWA domain-containing protein [Elusimicrobiales bacterium]
MNLFKYSNILLYSLALYALVLIVFFKSETSKKKIIKKIMPEQAYKRLTESSALLRIKIKNWLFLAALFLAFISAAGPQWGVEFENVGELSGNIVITVDTSMSMLAKDLKPDRMENAKLMIKSLISSFDNYRAGIVAFSGNAFTQCPLTTDRDAFNYFVSSLRVGMINQKGTDLAIAVTKSVDMLKDRKGEKTAIIITDGEDFSERIKEAGSYAAENQVRIFTVGIGSEDGELIPLTDEKGNSAGYKKDKDGKTVVTRLNEKVLQELSAQTLGKYIRYSQPEAVANEIIKSIGISELSEVKFSKRASFKNKYQIVLFIVLLLLLIEFILPESRTSFNVGRVIQSVFEKGRGYIISNKANTK